MVTRDMTRGNTLGLLVRFALPLMLGSIFQQMYTMVDAAIVGRFIGVHALAAVGAADWVNWLILGTMQGFTQGFAILTAQRFGAGDLAGVRRTVTGALRLTAALGLAMTVLALAGLRPLFVFLDVPADVAGDAGRYMTVCILGILAVSGYNLFAAVLRSLGNSRDPLVATILASLLNIGLDLLFVLVFRWGVAGAAAATVIGQGVSCVYCLWRTLRLPQLRFTRQDWRRDAALEREMLRLGTPMAAQGLIISIGGMTVQRVVNGFGSTFIAGYTATNKIYGLLDMAAISYSYAITTFSGQNLGARQYRRIRRGVNTGLGLSVATSLCISAVLILAGRSILSLFISAEDPAVAAEALRVGYRFLCYMAAFLTVLYLLYVYRSALQGIGDTVIPMISGFVELVMRVGSVLLLPAFLGEDGVFLAEGAAWVGATVLLAAAYYYRARKLPRADEDR